jgi:hypothetical protein
VAAPGEAALDAYQIRLLSLRVIPFADGFVSEASGSPPWTLSVCAATGATLHLGSRVIAYRRAGSPDPARCCARRRTATARNRAAFAPPGRGDHAAHSAELLVLGPTSFATACARLRRDLEAGRDRRRCARQALVHLSVAAVSTSFTACAIPNTDDAERQLARARYIDAHLDAAENARLAALCTRASHTSSGLPPRVVGCTPARHVQSVASHAAELLARTNLTIDDRRALRFANRFISRAFASGW